MSAFLRIILILAVVISIGIYLISNQKISRMYNKLISYGYDPQDKLIVVSVEEQRLYLIENYNIIDTYVISTSKKGVGSKKSSYKTPLGTHIIIQKIGKNAHYGELFEGIKPIGIQTPIFKDKTDIPYDYVTSRVLRLKGLEKGLNSGGENDSYERMIFIHGTAEEGLLGIPSSRGCIRMGNHDIVQLFDKIKEGTFVEIIESEFEQPKDRITIVGLSYYRQIRMYFNVKTNYSSRISTSM